MVCGVDNFFNTQSCLFKKKRKLLEGGTVTNIIPQQAKMIIETRLDSEEVNRDLEERV